MKSLYSLPINVRQLSPTLKKAEGHFLMGSHINPEPKGIVYLNDKKFSLAKKFHNALIALFKAMFSNHGNNKA